MKQVLPLRRMRGADRVIGRDEVGIADRRILQRAPHLGTGGHRAVSSGVSHTGMQRVGVGVRRHRRAEHDQERRRRRKRAALLIMTAYPLTWAAITGLQVHGPTVGRTTGGRDGVPRHHEGPPSVACVDVRRRGDRRLPPGLRSRTGVPAYRRGGFSTVGERHSPGNLQRILTVVTLVSSCWSARLVYAIWQ